MPAAAKVAPMLPGLSPICGRSILARFDSPHMSSDGGLLALREVELRLGIAARLTGCGSVANFCQGRTKTLIGTSSGLSDRFELEPLIENLDRLGQSRQTQAEGALDDASLATNVIRDVEG